MTDRPLHRVSIKVALIDNATKRVLLTVLSDGRFGLPGGHLEHGETPEQAILRESYEELGLNQLAELKHRDFWKDPDGDRLLLGFTAALNESTEIITDGVEVASVRWVSREDIENGKIETVTYKDFLLDILQ